MSAFIFAVMTRSWKNDKPVLPYVTVTVTLVLAFFLFINLAWVSPFQRFDFPPEDGRSLNPLLRHFGMIIHPPMLYASFTGMLVPFAFCISSLVTRRTDNLWLKSSRRWALTGWLLGLGSGGEQVAHPVAVATAFLHSAMIQEKRDMFKNWNMALLLLMEAGYSGTTQSGQDECRSAGLFQGSLWPDRHARVAKRRWVAGAVDIACACICHTRGCRRRHGEARLHRIYYERRPVIAIRQ